MTAYRNDHGLPLPSTSTSSTSTDLQFVVERPKNGIHKAKKSIKHKTVFVSLTTRLQEAASTYHHESSWVIEHLLSEVISHLMNHC